MLRPGMVSVAGAVMVALVAVNQSPLARSAESAKSSAPAKAASTTADRDPTGANPTERESAGAKAPECAWLGHRIIQVLARDDLVAAGDFIRFYRDFGCSVLYLGRAFGCSVNAALPEKAKDLGDRVAACWRDPTYATTGGMEGPAAPAPTPTVKPPSKEPSKAATPRREPSPREEPPQTVYPK